MGTEPVDVEIALGRYSDESPDDPDESERVYSAAVRWYVSSSLVDNIAEHGQVRLDWGPLVNSRYDVVKHGTMLAEALFKDERVRDGYLKARAFANPDQRAIRLRLFISREVPELHGLRWETMRDPEEPERWLLTDERILFSRYLTSSDNRHAPTRRKGGPMRALVIIANPQVKAEAQIDVAAEVRRAQFDLGAKIDTIVLASDPAKPLRITRDVITDALRGTPIYDIVYLVCHGVLKRGAAKVSGEPQLLLEMPDGTPDWTDATVLVDRIGSLAERPRLMILASCQSGGQGGPPVIGEQGVLSALGPRLVAAGVGAVIAMQGDFTMATASEFLPRFFEGLHKHGEVDRAMTEARGRVREREDAWMPALYSRLHEGRIWYEPQFVGEESDTRWGTIKTAVDKSQCLPILGSGLSERLFGSSSECARQLAKAHGFPLADRYGAEWPQVAQFVRVRESPIYLRDWLTGYWKKRLDQLAPVESHDDLIDRVRTLGKLRREKDQTDPHVLLAKLPFPIYITANQDTWMEDALLAENRRPVTEYLRWKQELRDKDLRYVETKKRASFEEPLVYHLLGTIEEPASLVLTEDDYLEYLMAVASNMGDLPIGCAAAWTTNVLLFLGFELSDWHCRLLFHSILDERRRITRFSSQTRAVAVQISPDEGVQQPRRALQYFQKYFLAAVTDMYAGHADDFVNDLWAHLKGERQ